VFEIRRLVTNANVVRAIARFFRVATCATLLDELEHRAVSQIDSSIERIAGAPACISFDRQAAATVGSQLSVKAASRAEKTRNFLARYETMAARALGQICWLTLMAGEVKEEKQRSTTG
jgi:hypothetical protein